VAYSDFAVGGVGLQIWRVAANLLNKQSLMADSVWSSILGVGHGGKTPKKEVCYELLLRFSDADGLYRKVQAKETGHEVYAMARYGLDSCVSGEGPVAAGSCERGNEPSGCIKCWEFLEHLCYWYVLKNDSAQWS
jgi:hypothetical protein